MDRNRETEELAKARLGLLDRTCSEIIAGQGLGTTVILNIGKVVRTEWIGTARRSREVPIYEASIAIQDATWRLEDSNSVICSSGTDDNTANSDLLLGLNRLVGNRIIDVEFCCTGRDLTLRFEKTLSLLIFSVAVRAEAIESYFITTMETTLMVGFDGRVELLPQAKRAGLKVVWENNLRDK